uniref:Putative ovule protein n=1 Tax=Solanum chacoense TaxID=4108 RepID=A0A0V0GTH2_SOLCH
MMAHKYVYVTTEENDCNSMWFYLQSVSVLIQYPLSLVKHHNLYQLEILLRQWKPEETFYRLHHLLQGPELQIFQEIF